MTFIVFKMYFTKKKMLKSYIHYRRYSLKL